MPSENFERDLPVAADAARCWKVLTDVALLTSWVPIVHDIEEIARLERYKAVLQDKVGPISLRADLVIDVEVPEPERSVRVHAEGEDRQVGSRIAVDATLSLEPGSGGGTQVVVQGRYQVTGRAASLGSGVIRKKADKILKGFFASAADELGGG